MAIRNLGKLLEKMEPVEVEGKYFMATVEEDALMAVANYLEYVKCIYREEEGLTVVFSEEVTGEMGEMSAQEVVGPFALITLSVNSDLMAVGFLAEITRALAKEGISVNAFSAYFHDHLLVPYAKREKAVEILERLSSGKK